jgi:hypothetical protein
MILVIVANLTLSAVAFAVVIGLLVTAIRPTRPIGLAPHRARPAAAGPYRDRAGATQATTA